MNGHHARSRVSRRSAAVGLLALFTFVGCSGAATPTAAPSADPTRDKLAQVLARGTLVLWTDPDYAPQSMRYRSLPAARTPSAPQPDDGARDDRL